MAAEGQLISFAPKKSVEETPINNAASDGVLVNGYGLRIDGSVREVYKFELKFFGKYANDRERDLSRGPKNDVSYEQKRWLLWELFQTLISSDDAFFGNDPHRKYQYVYDCGINFYASRPLLDKKEERRFEIPLESLSDLSQSYIGRRVQSIEARLLFTEAIDLTSKRSLESGGDRSVVQFLEILSSQMMIAQEKHHIFPQKMYEKDSAQQLQRDPRLLKSGMQKSLRFVGDSPDSAEPLLQIDPKKAAFFPAGPLGRFLEGFLPPNNRPLPEKIYSGKNLQMAVKQLKNIVVYTNHLEVNQTFAINGLTGKGSNEVEFDLDGKPVSVFEHFKRKYNVLLRFPNLPCVVNRRVARVGGQNRKVDTYYPIEVLEILDGQRVSIQKQTPVLVEQMIRQCQALPRDFQNRNEEQRSKAFIASGNPYFKAFGIRTDTEMQSAPAQLLFPPAIVYANNDREEVQPNNLPWRMNPQRKYIRAGVVPQRWAAVIVAKAVQGGECQEFLKRLVQTANNRGFPLKMPERYDEWDDISMEYLRDRLKFYCEHHCTFVMFFTRDKVDPAHDPMKLLETETGVKTQNITGAVMQKGIGQKGAVLVLENVLMKTHLKLGGVNYGLSTPTAMRKANSQIRHDVVAQNWLSPQRMIIGIDLSHSGPQSLYERQSGQPVSNPTVIGFAYTCGDPVDMRGTYWLQEPRLTIVQDIGKLCSLQQKYDLVAGPHLKDAMEVFVQQTGAPPLNVVIYRNGVSEGEYRKVITDELSQIHKAFEELAATRRGFQPPKITIVVAQRHSNYRIVPQQINPNGKPFEQNVPAGTVVDTTIMHPSFTEFLMVGHKTIQGTAHPVRYTVLVDEQDLPVAELEYVTYHLCYTHGIVCSPVSVPGPLYAAGDLAKRGRNNWNQYNQDDSGSMVSGESGGRFLHDGSDTYFLERSAEIKPKINTKFWA